VTYVTGVTGNARIVKTFRKYEFFHV